MSSLENRSKKACIQVQYHQYSKLSSISSKSGCPNNSIAAVVTAYDQQNCFTYFTYFTYLPS